METREGKDYNAYAKARNQARGACRKAVKVHEGQIAKAAKSNPKAFYAYAKSKLKTQENVADLKDSDGSKVTCDGSKAELLNKFFCSVFTVEDTEQIPAFEAKCEKELNSIEIKEGDVLKLLHTLNNTKSL
jgi:hypothetical protein